MISINIDKAKNIAHDIRRAKRTSEFAPLDVKATIPSEAVNAEQERQAIRVKYANIQNKIEEASSIDQIKEALGL